MQAKTPINTLVTVFGAFYLLTDEAATLKAMETYTGCRKAGSIRVINNTVKLVVKIEMTLLIVKTSSANSITFLRFIPENSRGVTGADKATTKANTLTVQPASGTVTLKVSAIKGYMPITPISVLIIPKHLP